MSQSLLAQAAYRLQGVLWSRIDSAPEARGKLRQFVKGRSEALGIVAHDRPPTYPGQEAIPDWEFYRPSEHGDWLFSPWKGEGWGEFADYLRAAAPYTCIAPERLYVLYSLARQALALDGDLVECGVWKGGSAILFSKLLKAHAGGGKRRLYLFDTFEGMPETHPHFDTYYKGGEFADTDLVSVKGRIPAPESTVFRPGVIPDTFEGLEALRIAFAHIDVDIYPSVKACCEFVYPRLTLGGAMVFDDYAWSTCPGARRAVDEYFAGRGARPLVLQNGQAVVLKTVAEG
jgi:O-methyltransferase